MSEYIKMHGPAFDGSGKMAETDVHVDNIAAFKRSGWAEGSLKQAAAEAKEETAAAPPPVKETTSTTPTRCGFMLKGGKQCGKDAVKGSEFCAIKSHK